MFVLENEGRRSKKKMCICLPGVGHGRAKLLVFCMFGHGKGWHSRASESTGRAKLLEFGASKFFIFLNQAWTITYKIT